MIPLRTEQKVLTWLCICPVANNTSESRKLISAIFSITVFVAISCNVIASVAYIRKFIEIDFEASLDAVHPVFGWMPLIFIFIVMHRLKHQIVEMFGALSNIYSTSKLVSIKTTAIRKTNNLIYQKKKSPVLATDIDLVKHLIQVKEKCERVWEIYIKYVITGFGASTVGSCLGSVLSFTLSNEQFNVENMYLQFKIMYAILSIFWRHKVTLRRIK